jgi:hypothetical protein
MRGDGVPQDGRHDGVERVPVALEVVTHAIVGDEIAQLQSTGATGGHLVQRLQGRA